LSSKYLLIFKENDRPIKRVVAYQQISQVSKIVDTEEHYGYN
jgi:hypothetical protein